MYVRECGEGDGRHVMFLHGGGVGGWMWNPTIELLPPALRLLVPDLPGHDRSSEEPYLSHAQTVRGLAAVIESSADLPVTVVGFSLGAQLAVLLAASRPDLVNTVAVISAQAKPTRVPGLTLGLLGATAQLARRRWFARLQARELSIPPSLLDAYFRTCAVITSDTLITTVGENIRFTAPPGWASFPGPALILAGQKERGFMKESACLLHQSLPGSELQIVGECGHGIPLQRPNWLARRLYDWIAHESNDT